MDIVSVLIDVATEMPVLTLPDADARSLTVRAKALVFDDPRSRGLLQRIRQIAPSSATVLVMGETGTGKEIVARHVHELSDRPGPFVAVNCGAFSETLVESELFGHERGAFTGAAVSKPGWFEAAEGGTLFLDEIGEMSPLVQVKVLRVLQERKFRRLGGTDEVDADIRIIAATNRDLEKLVMTEKLREDFYYRIRVFDIPMPPLRERRDDIPLLVHHFLHEIGAGKPRSSRGITTEGFRVLMN